MKRSFPVIVVALCITVTCFAQKTVPPAAVTNAFKTKFPAATATKWGKENAKEWEAEFKVNNNAVSANFGLDGSCKETESVIRITDLPAAVVAAIKTKYPTAVIVLAEKVEKPGQVYYEPTVKINGKKKGLEISADGRFM